MNIYLKSITAAFFIVVLSMIGFCVPVSAMRLLSQTETLWNPKNSLPYCVRISPCGRFFLTCEENGRIIIWDFKSGELKTIVTEDLMNIKSVKIFSHSQSTEDYFIVFSQKMLRSESVDDLHDVDGSGLTVWEYNFRSNQISKIYSYELPNRITLIEDFMIKGNRFLHMCLSDLDCQGLRTADKILKLTKMVIDIHGQKPAEVVALGSFDKNVNFVFCDNGSYVIDLSKPRKLSLLIDGSLGVDISDANQNLVFEDLLPSGNILLLSRNLCDLKLYNPYKCSLIDPFIRGTSSVAAHRVRDMIASTSSCRGDLGGFVDYFCLHDSDGRPVLSLELSANISVFDVLIDSDNLLYMIVSVGLDLYTLQISLFDYGVLIRNFSRIQAGIVNPMLSRQILYGQNGLLRFDEHDKLILNMFDMREESDQGRDVCINLSSAFDAVA